MMTRKWIRTGFATGVGLLMIGFWGMLALTGQIPELATHPLEIGYHLIAEGLTALALLASGGGLQLDRGWARRLYPVALGMLLYTVINSAGHYAHLDEIPMVVMFTVLTIATVLLIVASLRGDSARGSEAGIRSQ